MDELRGYVLEHFKSGEWKDNWGAVLVYKDYEGAEFFRKKGVVHPEEWSVVAVKIVREKKD